MEVSRGMNAFASFCEISVGRLPLTKGAVFAVFFFSFSTANRHICTCSLYSFWYCLRASKRCAAD